MVAASRLEQHLLQIPAHRPVDFPLQLDIIRLRNRQIAMMAAFTAVGQEFFVFIKRMHRGRVLAAISAIHTHRIECGSVCFAGFTRFERHQNVIDFSSAAQRMKNPRGITA
ncbi:hypothetical protein D3C75_881840 [compost metagenome]